MFYHPGKDVAIMGHGDDFIAVGLENHLAETRTILEDKYKLNVEVLGGGKDDMKSVKI